MHGATFGAILLFVVLFAASVFMSPIFIAPAVLLVLFALWAGPLSAMVRRGNSGSPGTPTTQDASYEPVAPPTERTV